MTCEEFLERVDALALDALDPDERTECAEHLRTPGPHRGCAAALDQARVAATAIALGQRPRVPSARVWKAIERAVTAEPRRTTPTRRGGTGFDPDAT